MGETGQTAGTYTLAGGVDFYSKACQDALARCGYEQDDFGPHEQVQAKIAQAKAARQAYVDSLPPGAAPAPNMPDARTAMLAQCTSGHLSQDAMYRRPRNAEGQPTQPGDSCSNYGGPPQAEARCYDRNRAPCMPVLSHPLDNTSGPQTGSPNANMSQQEQQQRATALASPTAGAMSSADISQNARANAGAALGGAGPNPVDPSYQAAAQARAQQVQPGAPAGPADDATIQLAAACIESFRQGEMERMRQGVINDYGSENLPATRARLQADLDAARADRDARFGPGAHANRLDDARNALDRAQARIRNGRFTSPAARRTAEKNEQAASAEIQRLEGIRAADRRIRDAEQAVNNADCLNRQVESLRQSDGTFPPNLPAFTGQFGA